MRHSKKLAALAIAAGVAIVGTAAFAYWSTDGSGTGDAQVLGNYVGGAAKVDVVQNESPADMVPGGAPQELSGAFTNTNPGGVWIDHIHAEVVGTHLAGQDAGSNSAVCNATDFAIEDLAVTGHEVAADADLAESGAWEGTIRMKDIAGRDQDGCKNAIVEISYTAHGEADVTP